MILTKISLLLLVMAVMNVIREGVHFANCFMNVTKYEISDKRLILLWVSASWIITSIILGL